MKILTEEQYRRRIEEAKQEGRAEAEKRFYEQREFDDFRLSVWHENEKLNERINRLEYQRGVGCEKPTADKAPCAPDTFTF